MFDAVHVTPDVLALKSGTVYIFKFFQNGIVYIRNVFHGRSLAFLGRSTVFMHESR